MRQRSIVNRSPLPATPFWPFAELVVAGIDAEFIQTRAIVSIPSPLARFPYASRALGAMLRAQAVLV
jgi:hypothetical protein